jgi:serine/threonine protein phosphatase PrpC
MPLAIDACVAQHIGDRSEQQDRVAIYPHPQHKGAMLAVLADGMGGHSGGALAAEQVLFKAKLAFENTLPTPETVRDTLATAINDAHDSITLTRFTSEQDPHSTACVFVLQPGRADWAHCGDSRIYHFRGDVLVGHSADHSYVMDLVRQGQLAAEDAEKHPKKNILTSCLGDQARPRIDHGAAAPLVGGDSFLLCSDGMWAYFTVAEMGRVLSEFPPRQAAEIFINTARDRANGRGDNCSLAIVRLHEAAPPVPPPPPWAKK